MAADGSVPTSGPKTMAQFATDLNEELAAALDRAVYVLTSVSGTNTVTASAPAWVSALTDGLTVYLKPAADNTAAVTLNINSIGAKSVVSTAGAALSSGALDADKIYLLRYYSADDEFRIIGESTSAGGSTTPVTRVYTSNSTWNKPAGLAYVEIIAIGPGGDGGTGGSSSYGGGGGMGAYAGKRIAEASLGASETVTIGTPGSGTATSFGSHLSCAAGSDGTAGSGASHGSGGAAGTATGDDWEIPAEVGQSGNAVRAEGGRGGGFGWGNGGEGRAANAGKDGAGYGAGGGGGGTFSSVGQAGGSGTGGYMIVKEYYA